MKFGMDVVGNLGSRIYDAEVNGLAAEVVAEGAIIVQREARNSIHHITHETEGSIQIRDVTKNSYYPTNEVYTDVPWALILEFHQSAFMRPGAKRARKYIRPLVQKKFGELSKGRVKLRNKGNTSVT